MNHRLVDQMWRGMLRAGILVVSTLAGCGWLIPMDGEGAYGVEPPTTNPDPTLEIVSLTYTPANPITLGTAIVFTATLNHPSEAASSVYVIIGEGMDLLPLESSFYPATGLRDDGQAPDVAAGDGVYTGTLTLPEALGAHTGLPVIARVNWWSSATPPSLTGVPLDTILPAEE